MKFFVTLIFFLYIVNLIECYSNVSQIIEEAGYPVQNIWVQTSDGFLLSIVRIPAGKYQKERSTNSKPAIFLQHGLLDTSATWVLNSPEESLGFILADAGFDVYLGNVRGNTYSCQNIYYSNSSKEFWDLVDFDNMASIDLPTMVNKALEISGRSKLIYVGHSQGTIIGFAGFPLQPDLASKIELFIALAPVAWVSHQQSILLKFLADLDLADILYFLGEESFLPSDWFIRLLAGSLCYEDPVVCADIIFLLCGTDRMNLNESRMDVYMSHTPGGTSVRNMIHWSQLVTSGKFQMFDYGPTLNILHYNQSTPLQYSPQNLNFPPMAFFVGGVDKLADLTDIKKLVDKLPQNNKPILIHEELLYDHLDFVWGIDAHIKIYPQIVSIAQKYSIL